MAKPVRGIVIIAVKKTGQLPELQTVHDCARRMAAWALAQGIPKKLVKVITDEKKPVEAKKIQDAVAQLVKEDGIEQIIVYFAGHGVVNGSELWLLSGAPEAASEAVNLEGSIQLARSAGTPHVVFISDACRTAAEGVRGTRVRGQEIFPNVEPSDEQPVDVFFACRLGSPSNEIRDPKNSAKVYKSAFTEALLLGLLGQRPELIEEHEEGDEIIGLVRPKRLDAYLVADLKERLKGVKTEDGPLNQVPYARLTSQGDRWVARFSEPRDDRATRGGKVHLRQPTSPEPVVDAHSVTQRAIRSALDAKPDDAAKAIAAAVENKISQASVLEESIKKTQAPYGPDHFESECGFKVRGNEFVSVDMPSGISYQLFADTKRAVRVDIVPRRAASALLTFSTDVGLVLPAIPGFIGAIEFEKSELVNVSYEPSENTTRWRDYQFQLNEFRTLRGLIAAAARLGTLTFQGSDAQALARQMQMAKNGDPFMAIYAAYAYHQLGLGEWMREMYEFQHRDLGFRLFDLALLTRSLYAKEVAGELELFPRFPLLSQGWTLLSANRVKIPKVFEMLRDQLVPSIWTLFSRKGIDVARVAMRSGDLT
jgi:hypothetical protein